MDQQKCHTYFSNSCRKNTIDSQSKLAKYNSFTGSSLQAIPINYKYFEETTFRDAFSISDFQLRRKVLKFGSACSNRRLSVQKVLLSFLPVFNGGALEPHSPLASQKLTPQDLNS